jgi:hypothetical protein
MGNKVKAIRKFGSAAPKGKFAGRAYATPNLTYRDKMQAAGLTSSFESLEEVRAAKTVENLPERRASRDDYQAHYSRDRGYTGPQRADKGQPGGSCNVTACQRPDSAFFYNHSTQKHYCVSCARKINDANSRDQYVIDLGHPLLTLDPQFADKDDREMRRAARATASQ